MSGGHAPQGDKTVALLAAIFAVLAALGTLFAHARSIQALAFKNEAVLTQAKASDQYAYYQARRVRYGMYAALVDAAVARDAAAAARLRQNADHEQTASLAVLNDAKTLEARADEEQQHGESLLQSFETLEIGTTLFEIAIVLASIATLAASRVLLWFGSALSAAGVVVCIAGYVHPH